MNGSEVETAKRPQSYAYDQVPDLTDQEKMDLVVAATMPLFKTICKKLEGVVIRSRNRAMKTSPANAAEQVAALTIAHAQQAMYEEFRGDIEFSMSEHIADVRLKVQQQDLEDQKNLEDVIFHNQTGQ